MTNNDNNNNNNNPVFKAPMLSTMIDLEEIQAKNLSNYYISRKIDGIRCCIIIEEGSIKVLSRSFKPIRNTYVRVSIEEAFKNLNNIILEGELVALKEGEEADFSSTSSAIMSVNGQPKFKLNLFDCVVDNNFTSPARDRVEYLSNLELPYFACMIPQREVNTREELKAWLEELHKEGKEGIILRHKDSPYKQGRATAKEGYLFKFKFFDDCEMKVIGYKEETVHEGRLGAILMANNTWVGTGFSKQDRIDLWTARESLMGRVAKIKCMGNTANRHPVFIAWEPYE